MGNYLYCAKCIRIAFGISKQHLSHQRKMKQSASQELNTQITKAEVEEKRLGEFVIMPSGCDEAWWKSKGSADIISVRYPHERHGLAGRVLNSTKTNTMNDFLDFVDAKSQPNGRLSDSHCAIFPTIQMLKNTVQNYEQRLSTSLSGEFNCVQREQSKPTISNYSASTWLKKHRPKHAIYPHKLDYCDTCASLKNEIQSAEMCSQGRARWLKLNKLKSRKGNYNCR